MSPVNPTNPSAPDWYEQARQLDPPCNECDLDGVCSRPGHHPRHDDGWMR